MLELELFVDVLFFLVVLPVDELLLVLLLELLVLVVVVFYKNLGPALSISRASRLSSLLGFCSSC